MKFRFGQLLSKRRLLENHLKFALENYKASLGQMPKRILVSVKRLLTKSPSSRKLCMASTQDLVLYAPPLFRKKIQLSFNTTFSKVTV